jgi:NDP-sugar pyrophosphorylase family protein
MKAIILAGGKGLRLRKIIKDIPKSMAPLLDKPLLEYLILQLKGFGIKEIILSLGYKADVIRSYFKNGERLGVHIDYSVEKEPLGTGGALGKAARPIKDKYFLAMNGDTFLDLDFKDFISYHENKRAKVTLALTSVEDAGRYGQVKIKHDGEITKFMKKRSGRGLINAGIYVFDRKIVDDIPKGVSSLEENLFPGLIGDGLYGMVLKGFFKDIGLPEDYISLREDPGPLLDTLKL